MRRRQVVLPDPEGPSIEKNSPSRMSSDTSSTARSAPNRRLTCTNRTTGTAISTLALTSRLPSADDRDVVGDPLVVGNALASVAAVGDRRPPEADRVEVSGAVGLAAVLPEERVAATGRRHRRHRSEPGREIPLSLRGNGMLEPAVGTAGGGGIDVPHRGIGPP